MNDATAGPPPELCQTLTTPDGRTVGFADYGPPDGSPVLDWHGGPGCRLSAFNLGAYDNVRASGLRIVTMDRPGYGLSTPFPGRSVADLVPDGLAVMDALGIDKFATVGHSTGGSYAAAIAALAPERVTAVLLSCAIGDMSWPANKELLTVGQADHIWDAASREDAVRLATDFWGEDGMKQVNDGLARLGEEGADDGLPQLTEADMALFTDGEWLTGMLEDLRATFTFGAQGYADDRVADGVGWVSFDVKDIRCPVTILHGAEDYVVPLEIPRHTKAIIPHADLRVVEGLGHFSIGRDVIPTLRDMLSL